MRSEKSFGCCEVAPSLLLVGDIRVVIPQNQLERVCVIRDQDEMSVFGDHDSLHLCVFSSSEKAENFMKDRSENYVIKKYGWDELVADFGKSFVGAMIDPTGEPGFFKVVPFVPSQKRT